MVFDFDLDGLEDCCYLMCEISYQFNEFDVYFIRWFCWCEGIVWYVVSFQFFVEIGKIVDVDVLMYMLVFCDQFVMLFWVFVGMVCYYCDGVIEECDIISVWSCQCSLVLGCVWCGSWDYKVVCVEEVVSYSVIDQGDIGWVLVVILNDGLIEVFYVVDGQ